MKTKICSNPECAHKGVAQPLERFSKNGRGGKHTQCKACDNKRMREYHRQPVVKERSRQRHRARRQQLKRAAMERLGGAHCVLCGCIEEIFLTIDHANGDGAAHRKQLSGRHDNKGGGTRIHCWILKASDVELAAANLRVLCAQCNAALQFHTEAELEAAIARNNARIALKSGFIRTHRNHLYSERQIGVEGTLR